MKDSNVEIIKLIIASYEKYYRGLYGSEAQTLVLGANCAIRAAAAFPALFSSMKLIVELTNNRMIIPRKSCQSGGSP